MCTQQTIFLELATDAQIVFLFKINQDKVRKVLKSHLNVGIVSSVRRAPANSGCCCGCQVVHVVLQVQKFCWSSHANDTAIIKHGDARQIPQICWICESFVCDGDAREILRSVGFHGPERRLGLT